MNLHLAPGGLLGPYRLLAPLGKGGMGVVYRAEHQYSHQQVALKTILAPEESLVQGIRREIRALARLQHPGVVRILEEGVHQGLPWFAMELLPPISLRDWRASLLEASSTEAAKTSTLTSAPNPLASGPMIDTGLTQPDALQGSASSRPSASSSSLSVLPELLIVMRRLSATLVALHSNGLLHRDLKPENILVPSRRMPVLVDFGLALYSGAKSREALLIEPQRAGTANYMSPEQFSGEPLDARADLYSLGVIFYELLTGSRPFLGRSAATLYRARSTPPAPPSTLVEGLPASLDALVMGLLSFSRQDRPGYAQDVEAALSCFVPEDDGYVVPTPKPHLYRPTLSGREAPLNALLQRFAQTKTGHGGVLLLGGESGVGKTRLVSEVAQRLSGQGRVLFGGSAARGCRIALETFQGPLRAIGDHCRARGEEEVARIFGARRGVLGLYEPSLLDLSGPPPPPTAELPLETAKLRLYSYLVEALSLFAQQQPLLLLLDDLQWADELSLGFLQFVLQGGPLTRWLLLVGTYRNEAPHRPLLAILKHPRLEQLALERLPDGSVSSIIAEMLPLSNIPDPFHQYISRHANGNPSFLTEYLRCSIEEGLIFRDQVSGWQLTAAQQIEHGLPPPTLRQLLSQRVAALSPTSRELLCAAAVASPEFSSALLSDLSLQDEERFSEALGDLLRRQLLEERVTGHLCFSRELLREVAYESLEPAKRQQLHRRLASLFERQSPLESFALSALGHHWQHAGEPERAQPRYLEAAREAARLYHFTEAEQLFRAYLALAAPTKESTQTRNELGEKILQIQGRMEEAEREHQTALLESIECEAPATEAESLRQLGTIRWKTGKINGAKRLYERALALSLQLQDPRLEGACLGSLGNLYRQRGQMKEARGFYEKAIELFQEAKDSRSEGIHWGNLAVLQYELKQMSESKRFYEKALTLHRQVGNTRLEGIALGNLASLYLELGELTEAEALYEKALTLLRETGDLRFEGMHLGNLGALYFEQGRLFEARDYVTRAIALHTQSGNKRSAAFCLGNLGSISRDSGQMRQALTLYGEALSSLRALGDSSSEGAFLGERAVLLHWMEGPSDELHGSFKESGALLSAAGDLFELGKVWCGWAHALLDEEQSGEHLLQRASQIVAELQLRPESQLIKKLGCAQRAQQALSDGKGHQLVRGRLVSDIPAPVRDWLLDTAALPLSLFVEMQ